MRPDTAVPLSSSARRLRTVWAVTATVLLWASAFSAIRAALPSLGPPALSVFRLVVACLALGLMAIAKGVRRPKRHQFGRLVAAGALGVAGYQLLLNTGQVTIAAAPASVIIATAPAVAVVMAGAFLREPIRVRTVIGVVIAFFGSVLAANPPSLSFRVGVGALLVFAAACSQAGYFVVLKPLLSQLDPRSVTTWTMFVGTSLLLPLVPAAASAVTVADPVALGSGIYLGVGASAVGFLTWNLALRELPVSTASAFLYLVPPIAALIGWMWLGEQLTSYTIVGGAVAISGVAIAVPRNARGQTPAGSDTAGRLRSHLHLLPGAMGRGLRRRTGSQTRSTARRGTGQLDPARCPR